MRREEEEVRRIVLCIVRKEKVESMKVIKVRKLRWHERQFFIHRTLRIASKSRWPNVQKYRQRFREGKKKLLFAATNVC